MELLLGLVVLAILGVMAFGFFGLMFAGASLRAESKAKANAPATLDVAFDGRRRVIYKINGFAGLKFDDVVTGAEDRGYRLTGDSGADQFGNRTLIFGLAQPSERRT